MAEKGPLLTAERLLDYLRIPQKEFSPYALAPSTLETVESYFELNLVKQSELIFKAFGNACIKSDYEGVTFDLYTGGEVSAQCALNTEVICHHSDYIIRIDTAAATADDVKIGDVVIPIGSFRGEGTTPYYVSPGYSAIADYDIVTALIQAAKNLNINYHLGQVASIDGILRQTEEMGEEFKRMNILAVDTGSSTLFTTAALRKKKAGSILSIYGEIKESKVGYVKAEYYDAEWNIMRIALEAIRLLATKER